MVALFFYPIISRFIVIKTRKFKELAGVLGNLRVLIIIA